MFETLQNTLQNLCVEFQPIYLPMDVDSEQLILRTRSAMNIASLYIVLVESIYY